MTFYAEEILTSKCLHIFYESPIHTKLVPKIANRDYIKIHGSR